MADEYCKTLSARLNRIERIAGDIHLRLLREVEDAEQHYTTAEVTLKRVRRLVRENRELLSRRAKLADKVVQAAAEINSLSAELESAAQARPVALCDIPQLSITSDNVQAAAQSIVDGALERFAARECGVYFLVNDGAVVYVGQSIDVGARVMVHMKDPNKSFTHAAWIPCGRERLNSVEQFWIHALRPAYNRAGMSRAEMFTG